MSTAVTIETEAVPSTGAFEDTRIVWVIVGVALLLRLGWLLLFHTYRFTAANHYDFGQEYGAVARAIASGHGYSSPFPELSGPTSMLPPLYTYMVAAVFKVFGIYSTASAIMMLSLNCIFSALTCWPIFAIAHHLANRRVALTSAWIWALAPPFMKWSVHWVWETVLSSLMLSCLVMVTLRLSKAVSPRRWIAFGLLWGATALLNPSLLSFMPISLAYIAWHAHQRGEKWLLSSALCCVVLLLTISPWIIRNYTTFGKFIFIRGNFWMEMRFGNATYGDGTWLAFAHPEINPYERHKYLTLGEQGYYDLKKREVQTFIRENPKFFRELCMRRVLLFWWDFDDITGETDDILRVMIPRAFSTLAFVGLIFALWKRRRGAILIAVALLLFPLPYYLTYAYGRYRHVIEPLMLICAVYCLAQVREFKAFFATD